MKDYDVDRAERHKKREEALGDRAFKIGGETFRFKANVSYDVLRNLTSTEPLLGADFINMVESNCLEMIEDDGDAHERFLALSKRKDDPITLEDLQEVFQGITEEAFKRPTEASSRSTDGDATTGTASKATSSTEPAVASAA